MAGDLLPCPFCGGDAAINEGDDRYYVACTSLDCYCCVGEAYDGCAMPKHIYFTEEAAAEAWNRRTPGTIEAETRADERKRCESIVTKWWAANHPPLRLRNVHLERCIAEILTAIRSLAAAKGEG